MAVYENNLTKLQKQLDLLTTVSTTRKDIQVQEIHSTNTSNTKKHHHDDDMMQQQTQRRPRLLPVMNEKEKLQNKLKENEELLAKTFSVVSERETEIRGLKDALNEKEGEIYVLKDALNEKEKEICALKDVDEREREICYLKDLIQKTQYLVQDVIKESMELKEERKKIDMLQSKPWNEPLPQK